MSFICGCHLVVQMFPMVDSQEKKYLVHTDVTPIFFGLVNIPVGWMGVGATVGIISNFF